jgi:penicillin-binding protein 1A
MARRTSAVSHGFRDLLDGGRQRLRGSRDALQSGREKLQKGRAKLGHLNLNVPAPGADRQVQVDENGNRVPPQLPRRISSRRPRKPQPGRVKKLRLAIIAVGLGALALISSIFGMMMALAQDLPDLTAKEQYAASQNTKVYDHRGRQLGSLLSNTQRILVESEDISPYIKNAVVAVEDERFYEHRGVDYAGIGRALVQDVIPGGGTQGASTITMQFVKNALEAQGSRTVLQKFREAALAYQLEKQWDKDKILTQYLNTIYFGEGAYGIEAAARTYFGYKHPDCLVEGADPCANELAPEEAALLAGIISSPSAYSPRVNPEGATVRRNLVLEKMREQGMLLDEEYEAAASNTVPTAGDIEKPEVDSLAPYFTSWLRQQVVDLYGAGRAFGGGLDVHTTLDLEMQQAVEDIAYSRLAGIEPTASVVVIDNKTGEVRAMVGGNDFDKEPFNLATNGHRQPGSSFKPFTLAAALSNGFNSGDVYESRPKEFPIPGVNPKKEVFEVENYDDIYYGSNSIASGLTYSDNSVYAELGYDVGLKKVADTAERMGIMSDVPDNPAITLGAPAGTENNPGGGFTPLEMAFAFNTFATGGERRSGNLDTLPGDEKGDPRDDGPVAITEIVDADGDTIAENKPRVERVLSEGVADEARSIMGSVVSSGTGKNAATSYDDWGKTGTTENNGDAWFVGGSDHFTVAVWVGHAQTNTPMETEYGGNPVDGGTFPAEIWASVIVAIEGILEQNIAEDESGDSSDSDVDTSSSGSYVAPSGDSGSAGGGDTSGGGGGDGGAGGGGGGPAPAGGGGGGSGGGGSTGGTTGGTGL